MRPMPLFPKRAVTAALLSLLSFQTLSANDWLSWRGPFQNGVSPEQYQDGEIQDKPTWTYDSRSRGTPIIHDGLLISFGYRGVTEELVELLTCLDAKTGEKKWEIEIKDFLSDTVYNRYAIGSAAVDPATRRVYVLTAYGVFLCVQLDDGKVLWQKSMMEDFGRLTFPNSKVGAPVIEDDLVIVRGITANWGAEGPAADRFYGFDKLSGDLVWSSTPGTIPPTDSSFSTPVFETRLGKRVFYAGTGCGHIVCLNARNGQPLWRFKISKGGSNGSPVLYKDTVIGTHGDENVDATQAGRTTSIKLPEEWTKGETPTLGKESEAWRNATGVPSSSPVLVGNKLYIHGTTGILTCINVDTGETAWEFKVTESNVHASPLYVDGLLYIPILVEGGAEAEGQGNGALAVVKPGETGAELVKTIHLEGMCLGSPAVCDGMLYLHTTSRLYCFPIKNNGITLVAVPAPEKPEPGPATALQIIPAEAGLHPGQSQSFVIRKIDANGFPVGTVEKASWESFIPPTAKVKATMDATFDESGKLVVAKDGKPSAGAFKATADGLTGTIRGRVLPDLPISVDFESSELDQPTSQTTQAPFAYPPLPWIGARFKFEIQEKDGNKVLGKTLDRILFQRAMAFIGTPEMSNYTLTADVMTDGNRRIKSDVGLINQRYLISLKGNPNVIEVSSNYDRLKASADFPVTAGTWYTMKTRVDIAADGTGTVRAKVWERGTKEPEAWTIEVPVDHAHTNGAPGIYGFAPQSQKQVFLDNITVTPN